MKLQTKKNIAREFLILITISVMSLISFVLIFPYNLLRQHQIDTLTKDIYHKTEFADSLTDSYNRLNIKQQSKDNFIKQVHNAIVNRFGKDNVVDYNEFYNKITTDKNYAKQVHNQLSIDYGKDNVISFYDFNKNLVDVKKANDSIPYYTERKKQADNIYIEISSLEKNKEYAQSKIFSSKEQIHFAVIILKILLSLLFIRYIFYSIKWSIKTLKQPDNQN